MNKSCEALQNLEEILDKLTGCEGCSWDKVQTPETLADYVIEESHELVAAIRSGNEAAIREELGDVAFLLLFIAHCFTRKGSFTFADALNENSAKMIRRHPHVFAGVKFANLDEQLKAWELIKKNEHKQDGLFASLPQSLPSLIKAYRIHSKAARIGFTWQTDEEVEQQVESEWLEWLDACLEKNSEAQKHELGDIIFSLVELGRRHGIKASEALDLACIRFLKRFKRMECLAETMNKDLSGMTLDEQDELWSKAKLEESEEDQDEV